MKILLDENIPVKLKSIFSPNYIVSHVTEIGLAGIKNGALMKKVVELSFDIFVTIDKNIKHQQNLKNIPFIFIVLDAPNNKISTLLPFVAKFNSMSDLKTKDNIIIIA